MICIRRRHHRENAPARARLTLADLSTPAYYGYLPSINLVYELPLLAIVAGFVVTLGARKLKGEEGRILKLLAGLMMLGLGFVMLLAAEALTNPLPPQLVGARSDGAPGRACRAPRSPFQAGWIGRPVCGSLALSSDGEKPAPPRVSPVI